MKTYKTKEFVEILKDNGYRQTVGGKSSHAKFINRHTRKSISVPLGRTELSVVLTTGIIKRYGLIVR